MDTFLYVSTLQNGNGFAYYSPTLVALTPVDLSCFEGQANFCARQNCI